MKKLIFIICIFLVGCQSDHTLELESQIDQLTSKAMYLEDENRNLNTQILALEDKLSDVKSSLLNQQRRDAQLLVEISQIENEIGYTLLLNERLDYLEETITLFSEYEIIVGSIVSFEEATCIIQTEEGLRTFEEIYYVLIRENGSLLPFDLNFTEEDYIFHIVNGTLSLIEVIE